LPAAINFQHSVILSGKPARPRVLSLLEIAFGRIPQLLNTFVCQEECDWFHHPHGKDAHITIKPTTPIGQYIL